MTTTRILVVAAHPDDEILGMGGTIAKHTQYDQAEVRILCLTDGSSTQYPGDTDKLHQKKDEAIKAADMLGVSRYIHKDLPDMRLDQVPHVEINQVVETVIDELKPHTVYVVHPDLNLDHQAVFRSVVVATRPRPGSPVARVLTYGALSSVEWTPPFEASFRPNWYSDITETINYKLEAFACYSTEERDWPHPRSARAIRAHAQACGTTVGVEFAEPFMLVRNVVV